jgi:hypothetical protein
MRAANLNLRQEPRATTSDATPPAAQRQYTAPCDLSHAAARLAPVPNEFFLPSINLVRKN